MIVSVYVFIDSRSLRMTGPALGVWAGPSVARFTDLDSARRVASQGRGRVPFLLFFIDDDEPGWHHFVCQGLFQVLGVRSLPPAKPADLRVLRRAVLATDFRKVGYAFDTMTTCMGGAVMTHPVSDFPRGGPVLH